MNGSEKSRGSTIHHWVALARPRVSPFGHLRPFMPQKTRVGNDRSQSTTDVARRRNRNEKLYKAGARSSVTLAAQNADRRAAVSEIELALSTHTRRMRFSGPLTGVLCKRPFPEFVAKIRIQRQRSSADIYRSCEQNCNRLAAFKNATVRERPQADEIGAPKRPFESSVAAVRDGSALTPFRWCSGFSLWERGRHQVRRSGGSFARSRTYWV